MYDVPEVQNSYEIINMRGTVRMKIRDILAKNEPTLSFEVFPPKTEDKYESVEMAASIHERDLRRRRRYQPVYG